MTDEIFEYDFIIPEIDTKLRLSKSAVLQTIEAKLERTLSESERETVWKEFQKTENWYSIFPGEAEKHGIRMYGASDYELYYECFKDEVEAAVHETVESVFSDLWDNLFKRSIEETVEGLKGVSEETITLENIENQTKERIQDENVKNGLARCRRETKAKSIEKWKEWYFKTHIHISDTELPKGKSKEDFQKHIENFYKSKE